MRARPIQLVAGSVLAIACNAVLGLDPVTRDDSGGGASNGGVGGVGTSGGRSGGTAGRSATGGNTSSGSSGGVSGTSGATNGGNETGGVGTPDGGETAQGGLTTNGGANNGGNNPNSGGASNGGTNNGGSGGTAKGGTATVAGGMLNAGGKNSGGTAAGGSAAGGAGSGGAAVGGKANGGTANGGTGMGGTGTGGSGTGGNLTTVATALDGALLTSPCNGPTGEQDTCLTKSGSCTQNTTDRALSGYLATDKTITLAGDTAVVYQITLHVQGVVEAKGYSNGVDQSTSGAHPNMDGFYTGGVPVNTESYSSYMIRVSSPKQDYFLNAVSPPGVPDHTTYGIDYVANIRANGGATLRLVLADPNCNQIKNCGPTRGTNACLSPITKVPAARAASLNPTFDFNSAYNGQWAVILVDAVTIAVP